MNNQNGKINIILSYIEKEIASESTLQEKKILNSYFNIATIFFTPNDNFLVKEIYIKRILKIIFIGIIINKIEEIKEYIPKIPDNIDTIKYSNDNWELRLLQKSFVAFVLYFTGQEKKANDLLNTLTIKRNKHELKGIKDPYKIVSLYYFVNAIKNYIAKSYEECLRLIAIGINLSGHTDIWILFKFLRLLVLHKINETKF